MKFRMKFQKFFQQKPSRVTIIGLTVGFIFAQLPILPRMFNDSYAMLLFVTILTFVYSLFYAVYMIQLTAAMLHKYRNQYLYLCVATMLLLSGLTFIQLLPIQMPMIQTSNELRDDTIYITYSKECEYCQKAHTPLMSVVNLWNLTQSTNIRLVDIENDTSTVAKQLRYQVQYKGTIAVKDGEKETVHQTVYTQGTSNGAIRPSKQHIFEKIKGMNNAVLENTK